MEGNGTATRRVGRLVLSCRVMYYKVGPKKKKTYLDGILFIDKKSYHLFVVVCVCPHE